MINKPYYEFAKGWNTLVDKLLQDIDDYLQDKPELAENFKVLQAKEKFGRLRIYVANSDDVIDDMIKDAECKSIIICEMCGNLGMVRDSCGWKRTRCINCDLLDRKIANEAIEKELDVYINTDNKVTKEKRICKVVEWSAEDIRMLFDFVRLPQNKR